MSKPYLSGQHRLLLLSLVAAAAWATAFTPSVRADSLELGTAHGVGPDETEVIASGEFRGADIVHRGRGTVRIVRHPDGQVVLEFEGFQVTNGPGLRVVLSEHENPRRERDFASARQFDLGALKASRGDQEYAIPADVDLSRVRSVVIYCRPYDVVFSLARLEHMGDGTSDSEDQGRRA